MIPLSVPNLAGNEWKYVKDCLDTGWISTAGAYVEKFENALAEFVGAKHAVATMNGTAALHLALQLTGVRPNDLVLIPNVTFVATANAVRYCGADPILVDIDPESWQMDLDTLESFLEEKSIEGSDGARVHKETGRMIRCLMPVHVQGHAFDLDRFIEISRKFKINSVEDAAEALGTRFKKRQVGTFAELGCFSFNGNKLISCGGGGMIVTNDSKLAKKAKHLSTTAKTDPMQYYHDEVGYNYRLVNILAAIGLAQMERIDFYVSRKKAISDFYEQELSGVGDIEFQRSSKDVDPNHWLFTIRTSHQEQLLEYLNSQKIISRPFWIPMNQLPMYRDCEFVTNEEGTCISTMIHKSCLTLPCSTNISESELNEVAKAIRSFFENLSCIQAIS